MKESQLNRGHYRVLKAIYRPSGEFFPATGRHGQPIQVEHQTLQWIEVGFASSMADAKQQFGGAPVLEWVRRG